MTLDGPVTEEIKEQYWLKRKLPLEKPSNLFRTPDTLEDMQEIVRESTPETMVIVAMVQNFLTKNYNNVVVAHNKLCDNLADNQMLDYDEGYTDGWDEGRGCLTLADLDIFRKEILEKD